MRMSPVLLLAAVGAVTLACSRGERPTPRTEAVPAPDSIENAANDAGSVSQPDERMLDSTISSRLVIFVEASDAEIEAMRGQYSEEEFGIVADDLMFYRSTAMEYLEQREYPLLRIEGRRPLRFQVAGMSRDLDLANSELLDLIVLYEPGSEPRVIAPNEVELTVDYFGGIPEGPR
jgi:hypothetical protein